MTFLSLLLPDWSNQDTFVHDTERRIQSLLTPAAHEAFESYGRQRLGTFRDLPRVRSDFERRVRAGTQPLEAVDQVSELLPRWVFEAAMRRIGPEARVLDFGSGAGSLGNFQRDYTDYPNPFVAIDLERPDLEFPSHVEFLCSDLHDFEWSGEPFDLGLAMHVFEHTANPAPLMAKLRGCIRDGGLALVAVPNGRAMMDLLQHRLAGQDCDHVNAFTLDGIRALLVEAGFHVADYASWPAHLPLLLGGAQLPDGRGLGAFLETVFRDFDHIHGTTDASCYGWLFVLEAGTRSEATTF